jgi:cytochrome P450
MSFALGAHSCVGAGLARLLCHLAVEAVLSLTTDIRLIEQPRMVGWEFRSPDRLLVSLH